MARYSTPMAGINDFITAMGFFADYVRNGRVPALGDGAEDLTIILGYASTHLPHGEAVVAQALTAGDDALPENWKEDFLGWHDSLACAEGSDAQAAIAIPWDQLILYAVQIFLEWARRRN